MAWAFIVGYEAGAPKGELLSEAFDDWITRHPVLTRALIYYTAAHLANHLPDEVDLFYQAARLVRKTT